MFLIFLKILLHENEIMSQSLKGGFPLSEATDILVVQSEKACNIQVESKRGHGGPQTDIEKTDGTFSTV